MRIRKRIKEKANKLEEEAKKILREPRLEEILQSHYLHDQTLPTPSSGFFMLVSFALLGPDARAVRNKLDSVDDEAAGLKFVVDRLQKATDAVIQDASKFYAMKREIARLSCPEKYSQRHASLADWLILTEAFREAKTHVQRAIARRGIEALTIRAVWKNDSQSLRALAFITENYFSGNFSNARGHRLVASEILSYEWYLKENLDWVPKKEDVRKFILGICPDLPKATASWSDAWKLLGGTASATIDRSGERDPHAVEKLIQKWLDQEVD
jgi:hypothetical protein